MRFPADDFNKFPSVFYIVVVKEGPHDRTVIFSGVLRDETSFKVVNIHDFRSFGH